MKNRLQFSVPMFVFKHGFFLDVASPRLATLSSRQRKIGERLPPYFLCRLEGAATRRLDVAVSLINSPVTILNKRGRGGGGLGCSRMECDQKREKSKSKALEIFSRKFYQTEKNFSLHFYSSNCVGCP